MPSVPAIRHVHFEDLGAFGGVFADAGYQVRYCDAGVEDMSALDPLLPDVAVVLGAPIGAYEDDKYPFLADELRFLRRRLDARRPTLGICLGAQLMARALGASVYPGPSKEIGWGPLSLTPEGMNGPLKHLAGIPVLHWHGDTFDLPAGAVRLASTAVTPNQAFSFGPSALALQFHAECDGTDIERWLIGHALEIALNRTPTVDALRHDSAQWGSAAATQGRRLLADWLVGATGGGDRNAG